MDARCCDACREFFIQAYPNADRSYIRKTKIDLKMFTNEDLNALVQITALNPAGNAIDLCPKCIQLAVGQALRTIVRAAGGDIVKRQGE